MAVGYVLEYLPDGVTRMMSPFIGGGSVEIACAKELGISVQGYDIFDILTNYWKVQLRSPLKLADRIEQWSPSKRTYANVKERLKGHWTGEQPIADRLELAAHYWFNHNLSYGPGFLGWMSGIYEDLERFYRLVDKVRGFRCPGLKVGHGSFEQTIPRHSGATSSIATRPTTLTATVVCSEASIRSGISQFTTRVSTMPLFEICCTSTKAGSFCHTTTARRFANGMRTSR